MNAHSGVRRAVNLECDFCAAIRSDLGDYFREALEHQDGRAEHFLHAVGQWWIAAALHVRGERDTLSYMSHTVVQLLDLGQPDSLKTTYQ